MIGTKVITTELKSTAGMLIVPKHLDVRKAGVSGEVVGIVTGHGGDVWFVKHEATGTVGAYAVNEMEVVK